MRNKKGTIDDWLPFVGSIVLMIFILIFFQLVISVEPPEERFLQGKEEIEAYQALNNYLRLYSDKIILTISENYDEDKLREETINFFNKYPKRIGVIIYGKKELDLLSSEVRRLIFYETVRTEIPYFNKNMRVELKYEK